MKTKSRISELLTSNQAVIIMVLLVLSIAIGFRNSAFVSFSTVVILARAAILMLIFALCQMLVIISGGIDVSFPAIACAAMYLPVKMMLNYEIDNLWFPFGMAILIGAFFGLINAVLIASLRIPPLIATLGMNSLISGGLLAFFGSTELSRLPDRLNEMFRSYLFTYTASSGLTYSLTILFIIPVVLAIGLSIFLRYTTMGRGVYAIGGNRSAARIAGFRVIRIQYFVYIFVGAVVGIGAMVSCILNRAASPTNLMGSEMMIIAAVVVGGTRITGGHGSVSGTILGVTLIALIQNNLIMLGIPTHWQPFILGFLIVLGTAFTSLKAMASMKQAKV
jgi:simple sugar transport system permease protein